MYAADPTWTVGYRNGPPLDMGLFIWTIQVLVENLGHGKHVHPILFEDGAHRIVAPDLPSIAGVLEVMFSNILPNPLNGLRTRHLLQSQHELTLKRISWRKRTVASPSNRAERAGERLRGFCMVVSLYCEGLSIGDRIAAYMKCASAIHFLLCPFGT